MIVEIRKAGFVNKGAELMLHAIMQQMKSRYPHATFIMVPTHRSGPQPFHKLAKLGMFPKASLWRHGVQWGNLARLAPRKLREMYGIVLDKEVDVVLDAAGFAYSDQFSDVNCAELASSAKQWRKNGTVVVLLPQAFGPYKKKSNRQCMKEAIEQVDMVFARERLSYEHLAGVVSDRSKIKLYPDFTNLVEGVVPQYFDKEQHKVCIVPNTQMQAKTSDELSERYEPFLTKCVDYLLSKKAKPFMLIHESEKDLSLARSIASRVNGDIPIIKEEDPIKIKGILGACEATIGSRFHGLVSALSQGVPSLATGWSHKYEMLLEDYETPESLLEVTASNAEIEAKIDMIIDQDSRLNMRNKLLSRSEQLKQVTQSMWQEVFSLIDSRSPADNKNQNMNHKLGLSGLDG